MNNIKYHIHLENEQYIPERPLSASECDCAGIETPSLACPTTYIYQAEQWLQIKSMSRVGFSFTYKTIRLLKFSTI